MQQESPHLPVVNMHVPLAAPVDGQLRMVESQKDTIIAKCCVADRIMEMLMERV